MELRGLRRLLSQLKQLERKYYEGQPPEVIVGYTQSYALRVHEVPAKHPTGKWKYLTDPAHRLDNDGTLRNMIVSDLNRGVKLDLAYLKAGMRIQRESQQEVPVDTSALKASAFTAYKHEVDGKARAAFNRSEAIRVAKVARRKGQKK